MAPLDTIAILTAFEGRGAGTDAERRAALALRDELATARRPARIEPFRCRPSAALAQAWHAGLGVAGGLVAISHPAIGGGMVLAALLFVLADATIGASSGRLLTPVRTSQNVVSVPDGPRPDDRIRLLLTANYDAGRMGLVYYDAPRRWAAALRRRAGRFTPGWIGWLTLALVWLAVVAAARLGGSHGTVVGLLQLPPMVALVLALALLLELGFAPLGPSASDNASGVAVVIAVARALDAGPPAHLDVEVVLAGAGEGGGIGLRRHLHARRRELKHDNAIVLGFAACGQGSPRWWVSDGALVAFPNHPRLRALCERVAGGDSGRGARGVSGRGASGPAMEARLAGLPAIALGCLDDRDLPARSHQPADTVEAVERSAVDAAVAFALLLVDEIDADVAAARAGGADEPPAKGTDTPPADGADPPPTATPA